MGKHAIFNQKSRKPHQIAYITTQTQYIRNYISRTKQRKNIITTKMKGQHKITRMLQKWQTLKLEHDAGQLQQEADKGNMIPGWRYRRSIRGCIRQDRNYVLAKKDGAETKTPLERRQRWAEWIGRKFNIPHEKETQRNIRITGKPG